MSENIYRRAPVPVYYGLVFLLNVALIIALELLLVYKHPVPLTQEVLARKDSTYQNGQIINSLDSSGALIWYLEETEAGEIHLVPIRRHTLFFGRCKILTDQIVVIPEDTAEMEVMTRAGLGGSTVLVGTEVEATYDEAPEGEGLHLHPKWFGGGATAGKYAFGFYFLMGVALSFLEAFLWHKIKG